MSVKTVATTTLVALALMTGPGVAHQRDLITAGGKVGPIQNGRTNNADMRDMFGRPSYRDVIRVGCSRVVRLRWRGQIQSFAYRADEQRRVVDVRVLAREVEAADGSSYTFHTRRGLRVGDSQRRLRELYPNADPMTHAGHTHYKLGEGRYGTKLLAKVVDDVVVQLEAAPYEYC
ncbi:MAG: hypothetical protein M3N53_01290 [Actinomycetota bacterium]|nr:hypothetical protein [Actinomycetota bacterium]